MTESQGVVPGAENLYLHVSADTAFLRCSDHPELDETHPLDEHRNLPAAWIVGVVARHVKDHTAEPTAPAATTGPQLDPFAREVAARCRWALDHFGGDPDADWPVEIQLAVALVLGNHLYLANMGTGPGYTPERAIFLLHSCMTYKPADMGTWIGDIRAAIRQPGFIDNRGPATLPTARHSNTIRDS
ncbi:hypothetical protein ACFY36_51235 [Actinoplanes sp. NPDC000266]